MTDLSDRHIRTDIQMQIVARPKEIHLLFSEPDANGNLVPAFTSNFLLSPGDALNASILLADLAFEADSGIKPATPAVKQHAIERHRATLTRRVEIMFNSMREDKVLSNAQLAKLVVEEMLREVFV